MGGRETVSNQLATVAFSPLLVVQHRCLRARPAWDACLLGLLPFLQEAEPKGGGGTNRLVGLRPETLHLAVSHCRGWGLHPRGPCRSEGQGAAQQGGVVLSGGDSLEPKPRLRRVETSQANIPSPSLACLLYKVG